MSKNDKIRQLARSLPEVPKLHKGKQQYDGSGHIIMLNHFRELQEIDDNNPPEVAKLLSANYVKACFDYQKIQQRKDKKATPLIIAAVIIIGIAVLISCV